MAANHDGADGASGEAVSEEREPQFHGASLAGDPAELRDVPHAFVALRAGGTLVAIDATTGGRPVLIYCGPDLPGAKPEELALLSTGQHAPGGSSVHLRGSMINEIGTGISGPSGLIAHRGGEDWAIDLRLVGAKQASEHSVTLDCQDANSEIATSHTLSLDPGSGVLRCSTTVENRGEGDLQLEWCASLCLPLDPRLSRIFGFTGRWSGEFQIEEIEAFRGSFVRENRTGRTSHDAFPGLYLGTDCTDEENGLAAGFHLAWSGNSRLRVDRHNDARALVQMGELAFPGEVTLAAGDTYKTPDLVACWSNDGTGDVSRRLHRHLNERVLQGRSLSRPRPVHYNTWEAIYFDHDEETVLDLVKRAASVGAERFVLDDGWFGGRRDDKTGLGDWWVSKDVYPGGLHRIADAVRELGMEFGLWFEPEMVNPDSDLFRAHPDWVLKAEGVENVPFRGQLTLDLTRTEVFDHLFEKITQLVDEYAIAYIKWDMNRDTNYPGSGGRGAMHRQTNAVYRLMHKLRETHPELEIESCSSGGARADYGILRYCDRIWTSDNNDARQRHAIQRGASHFFPLHVLGNHVGPKQCHVTGRQFSMDFRAGSAIFGHMGMELDLRAESDDDLETLSAAIALHKRHRNLIHGGEFFRLDGTATTSVIGSVAKDRSEALFSIAKLDIEPATLPPRVHLAGLDPDTRYRLRLVWPERNPSVSSPSIVEAADLLGEGHIVTGASLMGHGMQLPLTHPDTCLIYHLEAVG